MRGFFRFVCNIIFDVKKEGKIKNKKITVIAAVVAVVLISAMLIFVFSTNSDDATIDLSGKWELATTHLAGETFERHSNEYITFADGAAVYYRDGQSTESTYSIDKDNMLSLPQLNKQYRVEYISDDNYRLIPDTSAPEHYVLIIRYGGDTFTQESYEKQQILGKWTLTMKAERPVAEEYVVIEDTLFSDYRGASKELFAQGEYRFENNDLTVDKLAKTVSVRVVDEELMFFIETDTGYIWELHNAD